MTKYIALYYTGLYGPAYILYERIQASKQATKQASKQSSEPSSMQASNLHQNFSDDFRATANKFFGQQIDTIFYPDIALSCTPNAPGRDIYQQKF